MLRLSVSFSYSYTFRKENLLNDFLPENTQKNASNKYILGLYT